MQRNCLNLFFFSGKQLFEMFAWGLYSILIFITMLLPCPWGHEAYLELTESPIVEGFITMNYKTHTSVLLVLLVYFPRHPNVSP